MRVEKFDDELIDALSALGFAIDDDKETATLIEGDVTLTVIRPSYSDALHLDIDLPRGCSLHTQVSRGSILYSGSRQEGKP